jgi:hypothetical protein
LYVFCLDHICCADFRQTKHIQEALAACGWEEAANIEQQDTSEAFGFITEALRLPLLTLEMDIFHEGTGDAADDHKFINERLLEVAIPSEPGDGQAIKLEDCLEEYFNTRIEVVRRLGRRDTLKRSNTTASIASGLSTVDEKGGTSEHVEHAEVQSPLPITPVLQNSIPQFPSTTTSETSSTRRRATSIIRHRVIPETETGESSVGNSDTTSTHSSTRKTSIRKEVLMPAWQFFRIIRLSPIYQDLKSKFNIRHGHTGSKVLTGDTAWYTANVPANDVQVAQHFVSTRPVLGICLKRYAMSPNGQPVRRDTPIDIPLQIALPHFIQDDKAADGGPLFGNFNLVLQSVVCHRGVSVNSGHYISIIRGTSQRIDQKPKSAGTENTDGPPEYEEDTWIKFDDLASERVTYVDIEKAMVEEMPYLLFYQVRPLFEEPPSDDFSSRPPSYVDSGIGMTVSGSSPVIKTNPNPEIFSRSSYFENFAMDEPSKPRISFSDDVVEHPRNSLNIDGERRGSLAFTDGSTASVHTNSVPVTPGEETTSVGRLSRATSRFARSSKSKSRPTSHVDESRASMNESRLSATFSKLNLRKNSKDPLKDPLRASVDSSVTEVNSIIPNLDGAADTRDGYSSTDLEAEIQLPPVQEGGMGFGGGKNKRKSKTIEGQHHHTHGSKGKGKIQEGGEPDRECIVM